MARKPLTGTVAANVLAHGTGAINVDGCRVGDSGGEPSALTATTRGDAWGTVTADVSTSGETFHGAHTTPAGRWPANVVLDEAAAARLDDEVGERPGGGSIRNGRGMGYHGGEAIREREPMGDTGGPSRFFYTAKASSAERDGATHPTVKPLSLMRWLVRMVTPPGGLVLDPFAGSGTTLLAARQEHMRAIGIEQSEEYADMIAHRLRQLSMF